MADTRELVGELTMAMAEADTMLGWGRVRYSVLRDLRDALLRSPVERGEGEMPTARDFGARLREARVTAGLSLRDAAELLGTTTVRLSCVERGVPERPIRGEREEGEAEARDSGARQTPAEAVEEYIRALPWSDGTPDEVRSLVAGNIRSFAYWRSRQGEREEGTGKARDTLVRVACGIADNAPWRQSPDMDILKSVVQEYRAASPAPNAHPATNSGQISRGAPSAPEEP